MRWISAIFLTAAAIRFAPMPAEEPLEKTRSLCDPSDPRMQCPGASCICVDDTLEITFDGESKSVVEYDEFAQDMPIEVIVVSETVSEHVQGWSYGVAHDEEAMLLKSSSVRGTDAGDICLPQCEDVFALVGIPANVETCLDAECTKRVPGGGWISAIVLSFTRPVELPVKRNTLARASYDLKKDIGPGGTLIQVTDRLAKKGSPHTALNLTIDGRTRRWSTTVDGWVKKKGDPEMPFVRGDADGNGKIDLADAVFVLGHLFRGTAVPACMDAADVDDNGVINITDSIYCLMFQFRSGAAPPPPYPDCGPDPTSDANACGESNCLPEP